jgi:hypothetical protein
MFHKVGLSLQVDLKIQQRALRVKMYQRRQIVPSYGLVWFMMINATFSNISAILWRPVLVVEEARVPGENHRPWASNW